ncbi:MAG TPA: Crp/Fnr family transcriptional regulator, partial [Patescibacteria group bacterium]|nr:Crp/Fnr family transcriptional regulator [Patescibacteria group bacterium]
GEVSNKHIYEALTPITARKAPRDDVLEFLHNEPDIVFDLLRRVYVGMEGLWTHMESLTAGNAYTKLVASLIILAKRFGKPAEKNNEIIVQLKLGEKDIANYAGMSRETASRELQKLKKQHFVDFENGRISIQNLKALEEELNI